MKNQNLILMFAVIAATLFNSIAANASNTWRVNNQTAYNQWAGHKVFTELDSAVSSPLVFPGDTILVESSPTVYITTTITKKVTIIGTGYFLNQNGSLQNHLNSSKVAQIIFDLGSDGSTISGLWITSGNFPRVYFTNNNIDSITVTRCRIDGGIEIQNDLAHTMDRIRITRNYVGAGTYLANFPGPLTSLEVSNNRFGGNVFFGANASGNFEQNVIEIGNASFSGGLTFRNNIVKSGTLTASNNADGNVYNNIFSFAIPAWLTAASNNNFGYNMTLVFGTSSSTDGNLNPLGTCAVCPNGFGSTQIGMFGGSQPYILSGIPAIPAIYYLPPPGNAPIGDTLHVDIKTRSNN